jgi:hypothetical protein
MEASSGVLAPWLVPGIYRSDAHSRCVSFLVRLGVVVGLAEEDRGCGDAKCRSCGEARRDEEGHCRS